MNFINIWGYRFSRLWK